MQIWLDLPLSNLRLKEPNWTHNLSQAMTTPRSAFCLAQGRILEAVSLLKAPEFQRSVPAYSPHTLATKWQSCFCRFYCNALSYPLERTHTDARAHTHARNTHTHRDAHTPRFLNLPVQTWRVAKILPYRCEVWTRGTGGVRRKTSVGGAARDRRVVASCGAAPFCSLLPLGGGCGRARGGRVLRFPAPPLSYAGPSGHRTLSY